MFQEMKTCIAIVLLSSMAWAQKAEEKPKPLSSGLQAELKLLLKEEAELDALLRPLIERLTAPFNARKKELLERACGEAGIPLEENGKATCQVDVKTLVVSRVKDTPAPAPPTEKK
jgi:hypothetical protein